MSFTVYRSSAGSGKTFTLVREYLKIILLNPADFRHILAITFTNKAAAEMKERVLHSLRMLSAYPDIPEPSISRFLLPDLEKETGLTAPEIGLGAARVLRMILHGYSDFAIGTIDGFSHRVIRSFAHDFGLPVQFSVEMDAGMLLTTAVNLLLDRAGEDAELTKFLVRFLDVRMDEDKGWNIDSTLVSFARALLDEDGQEHIAALRGLTLERFTEIDSRLRARMKAFEHEVKAIGTTAMNLIQAKGLEAVSFYQSNKGIYKYFEYPATGRFDKLQPNSYVLTTISDDKWAGGKATSGERDAIEAIKPELLQLYGRIEQMIGEGQETYILNRLLVKTIFPLAVLNQIDRVLTAFKKQNNLIHISEFNRRISSVVLREPVPFIYERLGERYHHLMIDEFQDTSRLQWQNFIPLIENALASGYFNLVVGDGKQAIYRWRNGDVNQFTSLPLLEGSDTNPLIRQRQQVLLHHFREESLNRNYRSRAEIVGFNNRFFRYLAGMLDENGQAVYKGLEQEVDPGNTGGFVRISFLSGEEENYSFSEHNYSEIIQTIREVTEDGYAPGDIAILCRKNLQASRIARVLTAAGIDVVSSESLLLAQSAEVGFLISFIRFLFLEENPVNRAEVAGYLFQTGRLPGLSWPEVLRRIAPAGRSDHGLMNLLKEHGFDIPKDDLMALPLYDLCETLIRIFGLNRRVDPYVQFFLDAVMVFMDRDLHGAPDFSDWWEEQKNELSIVVPDGLHAVRIMTIHKSKGLQFPVVIFPFATETKRIARDHLWVDLHDQQIPDFPVSLLKTETAMEKTVFAAQYREEDQKSMLDLVNLLYVVMTRPEERLFILTQAPPEKSETRSSLPAFFSGFLQGEQNWEPGQPLFECGIRRPANRTRAETVESQLKLSSFISEDWRKKIRIKRRAPEMWNMEDPLGKVQFGNLVHTLLSAIHFRGDLDKVLRDASASGLFPADDHAAVRRMIQGVLDHPELATFYREGATVKTEPEILLPDGNSFRPDRVVLEKDHPVVIEYKTGKKDDRHARQLDQYETVLHDMGYENVHKYLVYLHDPPEVIVWKS